MQKKPPLLHKYTAQNLCFGAKIGCCAVFFCYEKVSKAPFFDREKTALYHLLDTIMMLTFFDAVVIAIATCSHRDSNMMLST